MKPKEQRQLEDMIDSAIASCPTNTPAWWRARLRLVAKAAAILPGVYEAAWAAHYESRGWVARLHDRHRAEALASLVAFCHECGATLTKDQEPPPGDPDDAVPPWPWRWRTTSRIWGKGRRLEHKCSAGDAWHAMQWRIPPGTARAADVVPIPKGR